MSSRLGKIALFIDGANLHATGRALGFDINSRRLLVEFQRMGALVRASFYTTVFEDDEFPTIKPILDWLDYNGYAVTTKPTRKLEDARGYRKLKGKMGIGLAVDAMALAEYVEQIVLFSGDTPFSSERFNVAAFALPLFRRRRATALIADELRRDADAFLDLRIGRQISAAPPGRPYRRPCSRSQTPNPKLTNPQPPLARLRRLPRSPPSCAFQPPKFTLVLRRITLLKGDNVRTPRFQLARCHSPFAISPSLNAFERILIF